MILHSSCLANNESSFERGEFSKVKCACIFFCSKIKIIRNTPASMHTLLHSRIQTGGTTGRSGMFQQQLVSAYRWALASICMVDRVGHLQSIHYILRACMSSQHFLWSSQHSRGIYMMTNEHAVPVESKSRVAWARGSYLWPCIHAFRSIDVDHTMELNNIHTQARMHAYVRTGYGWHGIIS